MKYKKLVIKISELSGQSEEVVRNILFALPDVLITMKEKDVVRTPVGVFRMTRRASRKVRPPKSTELITVPEKMIVKLRSGNRMKSVPFSSDCP